MKILNNYLIPELCDIVNDYLMIAKHQVLHDYNNVLDELETFIFITDCIHKSYKPSLVKMSNVIDVELDNMNNGEDVKAEEREYNDFLRKMFAKNK